MFNPSAFIREHEDDEDEGAMPRFGNGRRRRNWFSTAAVLASAAGFLVAAYLLAGLTGFLN